MTATLDELRSVRLGELVEDLARRGIATEQVIPEVEHVWWASLAKEITVSDPAYGAHDGAGLRRDVAEFAEADRAHLAATRRARARCRRAQRQRGPRRPPGAGGARARRGREVPAAQGSSRSHAPGVGCPHRDQAVLGDEPARRRVDAPSGQVVRRRRLRRGLAGAAGPGRSRRSAGRARSSSPATSGSCPRRTSSLSSPTTRRGQRRRRRRDADRGLRVGARRALRRAARPAT